MLLHLPLRAAQMLLQSILLALTQIRQNKLRSLLTMLGIIIGVASVAAVIAALTGLRISVLHEFEALGTNKIFISQRWDPREQRHPRAVRLLPAHFDGLLEHCPSVSHFTRIIAHHDVITYERDRLRDIRVTGIEPAWHTIENRSVTMGRPFTLVDTEHARHVCLITPELQDELRLPRDAVGERILIGNRAYQIVGIVEPRVESSMFGVGGGSSAAVFIPFQTAWARNPDARGLHAIATSRSPQLADAARAELRFFLRHVRQRAYDDHDDFRLEAVEQYLRQFNTVAMTITIIASGVVSISLLVGGVGIMNIMLVSVAERTREIGLRKAVGARPAAILLQFLVESVMISLIGGLIGVIIGQCIVSILAAIPEAQLHHAAMPAWAVALAFGFAGTVGVAFGMFPAIKAAQLDPIDALRHE